MGTLFLLLGFFIIFSERYTIEKIDNKRNMVRKTVKKNHDTLSRYKALLSIFSIILGVFCIANYIIF